MMQAVKGMFRIEAKELFQLADVDKNGQLSYSELRAFINGFCTLKKESPEFNFAVKADSQVERLQAALSEVKKSLLELLEEMEESPGDAGVSEGNFVEMYLHCKDEDDEEYDEEDDGDVLQTGEV